MRIAIISDTHFGVRSDQTAFLDYFERFYTEVFFPYLDEHGIKTIVHMGDVVDRRKYININTAYRMREMFFEVAKRRGIQILITLGNHDVYYKNTNRVNALNELLGSFDNVQILERPKAFDFDGLWIAMIPWICPENRAETIEFLQTTSAPIAMGHLEVSGFAMYKGVPNAHGEDPGLFSRFESVFTGHYHTRSSSGNIHYLGAPLEYTWSDYDDPRGFNVLDTGTREVTFVQNPLRMFKKIHYDDAGKTLSELLEYDFEEYRNCIVKVIVRNKTNPYWFDQFIDNLESCSPHDLQVVDDHLNLDLEDDEDIVSEAEDTLTIFKRFIDQVNTSVDKPALDQFITKLYQEALAVESM